MTAAPAAGGGTSDVPDHTGVVVRPVRFTDDLDAMRSFLETLGLVAKYDAIGSGSVELVCESGMVALRATGARGTSGDPASIPGQTLLSLETDDAEAVAHRLHEAGFKDAAVHDEGYARVLTVTDPLGDELRVDERREDLYGYRRYDTSGAAPGLGVVPVRFTDDQPPYAAFLRALGLYGESAEDFASFVAGLHGAVGLHPVYDERLPVVEGPGASCHLTFTTSGDLELLAERLRAAGHEQVRVSHEEWGSFLDVTDPDGQSVQVHADHQEPSRQSVTGTP